MAGTRPRGVRALALVVATAAALFVPAAAWAESEVAFTIQDRRVAESSGLATDFDEKLYWTVNDSGDFGIGYAMAADGGTEGTVRFLAKPVDIEAVAMNDNFLYFGDIGDNRKRRDFITVYSIANPEPDDETRSYRAYDFAYPDGAHDAETMLVSPSGRFYFVTKEAKGGIYRAPKTPSRVGVNPLRRVADAPAYVTDGVFMPDGEKIALRTYVSVEMLDASSYALIAQEPVPFQPQGESITVDLNKKDLLVGSEGVRSTVYRMSVPTTKGSVPTPGSSPPTASPTPTPKPTATAQPQEDEPPAEQEDAGGTWLAVGVAAAVAVRRRRHRGRGPAELGASSRSATQSTQRQSRSTSSGSTFGYIAIRSWLRPSLRYGSVSRMPLARSVAAIAAASTPAKSMVPTTGDLAVGSSTNGVAIR